jgi:branched-chain amino acid transport system ATP-binding protein
MVPTEPDAVVPSRERTDEKATLLELENVDVRYGGVQALRGVSLSVRSGEIVALLGSNGAGKSTTLRAISGLVQPTAGSITWQGKRIDRLPPEQVVRLGIAHVPEGRQIFPELTVEENLLIGSYPRARGSGVRRDLGDLLERFPKLAARRHQPGGNLSGGEQQMLAIARALMAAPSLVLLDEPSMGLAPRTVQEVFDLLADLHRAGTALLLVEQNARMALRLAQRAYLLETGRIALSGSAEQLRSDPEVERTYLGLRELVR